MEFIRCQIFLCSKSFGWLFMGLSIVFGSFVMLGLSVPIAMAETTSDGFVITSDRLEMDENKHKAVFFGDVRAKEQRMRLNADKMTVNYYRGKRGSKMDPQSNQGGVDTVTAEGHVVLLQGESRGSAEQMIYQVESKTLEMLGLKKNASIRHGEDRLEGKKILLTLGPDRSILKVSVQGGGKRRVSARITPSTGEDANAGLNKAPLYRPQKRKNSFIRPMD